MQMVIQKGKVIYDKTETLVLANCVSDGVAYDLARSANRHWSLLDNLLEACGSAKDTLETLQQVYGASLPGFRIEIAQLKAAIAKATEIID